MILLEISRERDMNTSSVIGALRYAPTTSDVTTFLASAAAIAAIVSIDEELIVGECRDTARSFNCL
jgi:hypothetical protein